MSEFDQMLEQFYAANPNYESLSLNQRIKLKETAGFFKASRCMTLAAKTDFAWMAHQHCAGFCKTLSTAELDIRLA